MRANIIAVSVVTQSFGGDWNELRPLDHKPPKHNNAGPMQHNFGIEIGPFARSYERHVHILVLRVVRDGVLNGGGDFLLQRGR